MQSSYQFHYGGQAAAAKGANNSSPTKSPGQKATGAAAQGTSSMFTAKVDWGSGPQGAAASQSNKPQVPFGFGGSSQGAASFGGGGASFGGSGATQGASAQPSFGGPSGSATGLAIGSQASSSRASAAPSFGGGPSASSMGRQAAASFGGPAAGGDPRGSSAASSSITGFGFSASNWTPQDSTEYSTNCTSVKEYAYAEDKNQRFRPQMEDTHCIVDKVIPSDPSAGLFAIFDGHGGRQVSDYCAERFPLEIKKEMQKNPADMTQSLKDVFLKVNNELRLLDSDGCGSTACVCIVRKEGSANVLYVANVGDTRAVLSKSGHAERLSIDDKCDNPQENLRVKSGGGIILDNRLGGVLAVTRAFGDHALTKVGLIAEPHIVKYTIKPFDKYLVIASDGVWDELSDQDSIGCCHEDISTKQIAQQIVKNSLTKGSKDNISVIVLKFNGATGAHY